MSQKDQEIIVEFILEEGQTINSVTKPFIDNFTPEELDSLKEMFASKDKNNKSLAWGMIFGRELKNTEPRFYLLKWYLDDPDLEHLPDMMTSYKEQEDMWKTTKKSTKAKAKAAK